MVGMPQRNISELKNDTKIKNPFGPLDFGEPLSLLSNGISQHGRLPTAQCRCQDPTSSEISMNQHNQEPEQDPVEAVVKHMHIVLPIVGAVLMFLMIFIAITMA